jgi:threonine/homoserine/homoserine lactone efflux protein
MTRSIFTAMISRCMLVILFTAFAALLSHSFHSHHHFSQQLTEQQADHHHVDHQLEESFLCKLLNPFSKLIAEEVATGFTLIAPQAPAVISESAVLELPVFCMGLVCFSAITHRGPPQA